MDHPEYLEHQETDGQSCDLLTRVPYDRQRIIEVHLASARSIRDQENAALRGLLWTAVDAQETSKGHAPHVKHALTGEWTDDVGSAGAEVIQPWRVRAMELYNLWYADAFPSPKKGSGRTGKSIPTGSPPSETNAKT